MKPNFTDFFFLQRKTGKLLYRWLSDQEERWSFGSQKHEVRVSEFVNNDIFIGKGVSYNEKSKLYMMDVQHGKLAHE